MLKVSYGNKLFEAGCDEAGRGSLAGPVIAAAVILPSKFNGSIPGDSKQLSITQRALLRLEIERWALTYGIGAASNEEIDDRNILQASIDSMHRALAKLDPQPDSIIVDGNYFKSYHDTPHTCIIKGDSLYCSIAAASILAKTARDDIMVRLHDEFPVYGWDKNKGYPTKKHVEALKRYGPSIYHRKSFKLL